MYKMNHGALQKSGSGYDDFAHHVCGSPENQVHTKVPMTCQALARITEHRCWALQEHEAYIWISNPTKTGVMN